VVSAEGNFVAISCYYSCALVMAFNLLETLPQPCRSHGVRFRKRPFRFCEDIAFPSGVRGPVDKPPCKRQRPLEYRSRLLHGVPFLVLAPQMGSLVSIISSPTIDQRFLYFK
jgi:hypothetical protein